jgi:hypothetical protein
VTRYLLSKLPCRRKRKGAAVTSATLVRVCFPVPKKRSLEPGLAVCGFEEGRVGVRLCLHVKLAAGVVAHRALFRSNEDVKQNLKQTKSSTLSVVV